jgi:hypothetical protein
MGEQERTVAEMQALILDEARRLGLPWPTAAALHDVPRHVVWDWLGHNILGFRDAYEAAHREHRDEKNAHRNRHADTNPKPAAWLRRHGYTAPKGGQ